MPLIAIETLDHDGSFNAYLAEPAGTPAGRDRRHPGDFRGQSRHPRQMRPLGVASAISAIAPDLFWRIQEGVELDPDVPGAVPGGARPDAEARSGQGDRRHRGRRSARRARACREGGQGRRGRLLPRRPARLHDRGAHRRGRLGRLLWRRPRGAAGRKARHRPAADAAHRRRRPFRDARQAGADPRRAWTIIRE